MTKKRRINQLELYEKKYSEYVNSTELLDNGEVTLKILLECMPKSPLYHVQYVNKNDVISIYNELKYKIPMKLKEAINSFINPNYNYLTDKCARSFIEIIEKYSDIINLNLIYSIFEKKLNSYNLEEHEYFP